MKINTNLSSLIVQSSLKSSTKGLNTAIERMTTGFKINRAKDNAANFSINTHLSTKISGYQVAEDNALQGLDLITTASESLDLINNMLSRIRDLTEQASNGTYGEDSLKAINAEVNALVDEINRIFSTCEFNGIKLFDNNVSDTSSGGNIITGDFVNSIVERDTSDMVLLETVDTTEILAEGSYKISTAQDLLTLAELTHAGLLEPGREFILANDIDMAGIDWISLGIFVDDGTGNYDEKYVFKGILDGNGHTIKNLQQTVVGAGGDSVVGGLFGYVVDTTIKNLALENVTINAHIAAAAPLVSAAYGNLEISNVYVTNSVINADNTVWSGGLVGCCYGGTISIIDSKSDLKVNAANDTALLFGGAVGYVGTEAFVDNFEYSGAINVNGVLNLTGTVGGLVGQAEAGIYNNCIVSGDISAGDGIFWGAARNTTLTNSQYASVNSNLDIMKVDYGNNTITNITEIAPAVSTFALRALPAALNDASLPVALNNTTQQAQSNCLTLQIGINSSESSRIQLDISFELPDVGQLRGIGNSDVNNNYLSIIDSMLSIVSAKQTEYGAVENRLESALEEISVHYENLVSSRSTLRDADIAEDSSAYIRNQILQQAAATLLATANQTPAIAIQLL